MEEQQIIIIIIIIIIITTTTTVDVVAVVKIPLGCGAIVGGFNNTAFPHDVTPLIDVFMHVSNN
jgi:hypothetical protein